MDMRTLTEFMKESWADILDIPEHEIRIDDTFTELGGTALRMYCFLYNLESFLGMKLNAHLFTNYSTINEISMFLLEDERAFKQ